VSAAIKTNTFDWDRIGQFYWTMVLPYVLSYAVLYAVDLFVLDLLRGFPGRGPGRRRVRRDHHEPAV
jgi:hypothetical protein